MKRNSTNPGLPLVACVIFASLILSSPAFAQTTATGPHTTITLVADRGAAARGTHLSLGLHLQLENGWHVYWMNPGDSGEPPKVQWQLPSGFHAGPMEWPAPQRLTAPSIVDYGYENDVLLVTPVSISPRLNGGATATIGATVGWLVCREMCIPGKAQLSLTLPVSAQVSKSRSGGDPLTASLFRAAEARIPMPAPARWTMFASPEKNHFVLVIRTGKREATATFFPLEAEQIDNDAPQEATPLADGVRLKLQKSEGLLKPITQLRGVLELSAGRAYEIAALVRAAR